MITIFLTGCAHKPKGNVAQVLISEGGIEIKRVDASNYNFEISMYENKPSPIDIYGINSSTTEDRASLALEIMTWVPALKYESFPRCLVEPKIVGEEKFVKEGQYKKWLNGYWWKVMVLCEKPNEKAEI